MELLSYLITHELFTINFLKMNKKITKEMTIEEILKLNPDSGVILEKEGLYCVRCEMRKFETLQEGAEAHGFDEKEIEELLKKLNS